jgi:hypothetical protein
MSVFFTVRIREGVFHEHMPFSCAELEKAEGRKCWVRATVKSSPDGDVYAEGKALFVIPKSWNPPPEEAGRAAAHHEVETESELERVAQRRASVDEPSA